MHDMATSHRSGHLQSYNSCANIPDLERADCQFRFNVIHWGDITSVATNSFLKQHPVLSCYERHAPGVIRCEAG